MCKKKTHLDTTEPTVGEVAKPQLHSVARRSPSDLLELESSRLDEPDSVHQVARTSEKQALRLDRERSLGSDG